MPHPTSSVCHSSEVHMGVVLMAKLLKYCFKKLFAPRNLFNFVTLIKVNIYVMMLFS
jgi:hypothetical protein